MKIRNIPHYILIIILSLVGFGLYVNSLNGDFLIDDQDGILNNERIQDVKIYFSNYFKLQLNVLYDVLRVFAWHISKDNPFYYHLLNILFHVSCVILVYILCNTLFSNKPLSFLSSLIFAIHPIHTEAVSWISGGHYVFSSLFFIASFIFYVKSSKSIYYILLSAIFLILCLFSGNAFASLPLLFILYDLFLRERIAERKILRLVRLIFLSSILFLALMFIGIFFANKNQFMHLIFYFRGFSYLIVAAKAFIYYLKILYLPIQRGLYHPFAFNTTEIQSVSPALFLSVAVLALALISFFKFKRSLRPVSFGIMWFLVTYLPYSNIIPVCNIISERYLYLPSVGFSIIVAAVFLKVWQVVNKSSRYKDSLRAISIIAIVLFLGSYVTLTVKRNIEYSNIFTYWESNIKNFPDGYIVYNNLAGTYYTMGNIDNAIAYCRINLMVNSNQPHVWYNLAKVYRKIGDIKQASECFEEVLKIDKNYLPARKALDEMESSK